MKWWHLFFGGFCIFTLFTVYNANAVSLSIPAVGSELIESEYDTNNDLVETAVSELDAVDATKLTATRFTNASTSFDSRLDAAKTEASFNTYSANEVTRNALKAPLASPTFTGTLTTAPTVVIEPTTTGAIGTTFNNSSGFLMYNQNGTRFRVFISASSVTAAVR